MFLVKGVEPRTVQDKIVDKVFLRHRCDRQAIKKDNQYKSLTIIIETGWNIITIFISYCF